MNNLALRHDRLGVVILVGQPRPEDQEHHQTEAEHHQTCLLVLQHIDLHDIEGRKHADHHCSYREAHTDDGEDAHFPSIHKFLIAVGDDLFLKHLLQTASGHRGDGNRKDRLVSGNLLRCLAGAFLRSLALCGKCGRSAFIRFRRRLLKLFVYGLATGFCGKCCGCSTCRCSGCRGSSNFLRRIDCRVSCAGGLLRGLDCRIGCSFRRIRDRRRNIRFRRLFYNGIVRLFPLRFRCFQRHCFLHRFHIRSIDGFVSLDGIRLCDRVLRAIQKASLRKELCECLLLCRRIVLRRRRVLYDLHAGLCGKYMFLSRLLRSCTVPPGIRFRIVPVFSLTDLADEVHLFLKRRSVRRHLGDAAVCLVN